MPFQKSGSGIGQATDPRNSWEIDISEKNAKNTGLESFVKKQSAFFLGFHHCGWKYWFLKTSNFGNKKHYCFLFNGRNEWCYDSYWQDGNKKNPVGMKIVIGKCTVGLCFCWKNASDWKSLKCNEKPKVKLWNNSSKIISLLNVILDCNKNIVDGWEVYLSDSSRTFA